MAGKLKKSNVKKKSQRAIEMAEAKKLEEEKEQAKKDAAIKKKKNYNKNAIDTMFPLYGLICAILSFLFNKIGFFSIIAIILGTLGIKRNADRKDTFYKIAIADVVVGGITGVLFILYITGVIHQ